MFLILILEKMNSSLSKVSAIILIFLIFLVFCIMGLETKKTYFVLAGLILFITCFMIYSQIYERYAQDDPKLKEIKGVLEEFFSRQKKWKEPLTILNQKNIMKDITFYRGNKSYTINKEKVYICLKDPKGEYYDDNTLYYVIGHELSHAICDEIGHTEKFHNIFEALLLKMEKAGIYTNKIPISHDYCKEGDPEMK